ncbi:MAG: hypothetical protein Q8M99_10575 [Methylotenera sp.]|nr:hypothetical protein [Methylotenera sp.]
MIAAFISVYFKCTTHDTNIALQRLAFWDVILRYVKLPHAIYGLVSFLDKRVFKHFVYYLARTKVAIEDIGFALNGNRPLYEPELKNLDMEQLNIWREQCLKNLHLLHPLPIQYFKIPRTTGKLNQNF